MSKTYLNAQIKTNELIISNSVSADELSRFSNSDLRWAESRSKKSSRRTVRKGEVYQFEFGKNYIPEMSYEHRGLVIGVRQQLLYVLPIFSYDPAKHPDVFHPVDFPNSKSDLYLLKSSEFSFIGHDSVLKLNDIRTVSMNRILYQQHGQIPITSDAFLKIESLAFQKYFPTMHYDFEQLKQLHDDLTKQLRDTEAKLNAVNTLCEEYRQKIDELTKHGK